MSVFSRLYNLVPLVAGLFGQRRGGVNEGGTARSLSMIVSAGLDHVHSLFSLFLLEMEEAAERVRNKAVCLAAGVFLLFFTYIFFCVTVTVLLNGWLNSLLMACGVMFLLHVIGVVIAFVTASRIKVGPIAPETRQELQSDYECLQIAIKESRNS